MICEKVIVGEGTQFPLDGMLTFPDDISLPVPAVVMVHGSGASNMDEKVMALSPFKDLAEGLAAHGVASLRYDKRTFTYGKQMAKMDATASVETIDDAILALEILKNDPRIDSSRIYVLGHSMGAMLAPRIDAEWGNAAGLIMLAGTPYRLEDIVLRQLNQAKSGNPVLGWIIRHQYKKYARKFENLYQMSDEEARKLRFAGNLSLYYFKEMGQKTAGDYLLEYDKPVLIMQGGRDFQVLEDVDLKGFKEILAGKTNVEYKVYPELNHVFVQAIQDDIMKASRDYKTERHIGEEVIGDIAECILRTA